jgi:hypothetical protein
VSPAKPRAGNCRSEFGCGRAGADANVGRDEGAAGVCRIGGETLAGGADRSWRIGDKSTGGTNRFWRTDGDMFSGGDGFGRTEVGTLIGGAARMF